MQTHRPRPTPTRPRPCTPLYTTPEIIPTVQYPLEYNQQTLYETTPIYNQEVIEWAIPKMPHRVGMNHQELMKSVQNTCMNNRYDTSGRFTWNGHCIDQNGVVTTRYHSDPLQVNPIAIKDVT